MFCQMQQLCSLTSMSWLQSCSFYGQPPLSLIVILSQPQEMMNNMLVVSIQEFLLQSLKSVALTLKHLVGTAAHAFSHFLCEKCQAYLMFSLHFLSCFRQSTWGLLNFLLFEISCFSILGAPMVFFCLQVIFYCKMDSQKTKNKLVVANLSQIWIGK